MTIAASPPSLEHPLELLGEQEQRRDRRRVVGLVLDASSRARSQRQEVGDPAPDRGRRRAARSARAPPGSTARATVRRRRRSPSAARSSRRRCRRSSTGRPPAAEVASISTSAEPESAGRCTRKHHAGRGLVVRPGDHVGGRIRASAQARPRARPRRRSVRRETARRRCSARTSTRTLRSEVQRALADQTTGRRVPERGCPAVAERHLVAVGELEQLRESGANLRRPAA